MKQGCGLIVTLDGIYYEGNFLQDVLSVSVQDNAWMLGLPYDINFLI